MHANSVVRRFVLLLGVTGNRQLVAHVEPNCILKSSLVNRPGSTVVLLGWMRSRAWPGLKSAGRLAADVGLFAQSILPLAVSDRSATPEAAKLTRTLPSA